MSQTSLTPPSLPTFQVGPINLDDLEQTLLRSRAFAWGLITGLPALGLFASLLFGLPLFAAPVDATLRP